MIWKMQRLILQVLKLLAGLQMGKRAPELDYWICTLSLRCYSHMISCAFLRLHQDVSLLHPPTVHWNVHICFRCPGSGWASNALHFRRVSRSKAFPKRGDLPEQVMKVVTACVGLRWCASPTLTTPVLLQHSLSGHLDCVCQLFESEACLHQHLLFLPNLLSWNSPSLLLDEVESWKYRI